MSRVAPPPSVFSQIRYVREKVNLCIPDEKVLHLSFLRKGTDAAV